MAVPTQSFFEEDNYDDFVARVHKMDTDYVHLVYEHRWGQRVLRIYDPDKHIIEIGENLSAGCRRFTEEGLSAKQTAQRNTGKYGPPYD